MAERKRGYLYNEEAERSLIVHLLGEAKRVSGLSEWLPEGAFSNEVYQKVYSSIVAAPRGALGELNEGDVAQRLSLTFGDNESCFELVRNLAYSGVTMGFEAAARRVYHCWLRREMVDRLSYHQERLVKSEDLEACLHELMSSVREASLKIRESSEGSNVAVSEEIISEIETNRPSNGFLSTGLFSLDKIIGGVPKGQITLIASRPSMGKTSLACNMVVHALRSNRRCLFLSFETSVRFVTYRLVSIMAGLNSRYLIERNLSGQGKDKMLAAMRELRELYSSEALKIVDSRLDLPGLVREVRQRASRRGVDLVVLDFIQLMTLEGVKQVYIQINEIMAELKQLATELDVAFLVLSQLSRSVEARNDHVPQLSDLAFSGGLETAADIVLLLWREQYYLERRLDRGDSEELRRELARVGNQASLLVAKNRNGPVGHVSLYFNASTGKFANMLAGADPEAR